MTAVAVYKQLRKGHAAASSFQRTNLESEFFQSSSRRLFSICVCTHKDSSSSIYINVYKEEEDFPLFFPAAMLSLFHAITAVTASRCVVRATTTDWIDKAAARRWQSFLLPLRKIEIHDFFFLLFPLLFCCCYCYRLPLMWCDRRDTHNSRLVYLSLGTLCIVTLLQWL